MSNPNASPPPKTTRRQHAGRFAPGQSGNPAGRPRGARHATTIAIEALLEGEAEGLTRKAVELALAGDTTALRLCLERIAPAARERTVTFDLPPINGPQDAPNVMLALLTAVAAGALAPGEAESIGKLLEAYRRAIETADLEARIGELEATQTLKGGRHG